ncbi:hypothetical protein [Mycobacterium antarcticum]|uniref:hypothetical protein n=1 Tax=unclassified Mycolicibacterium TaxID=2636767 RepID=UPI0024E0EA90|nr:MULTISPECIES: hypothetical protein [unclassified Mycolicibacterium]
MVCAAEFPPLTVWLGPLDWLPVVGASLAGACAGGDVAVVEGAVDEGSELTEGGEVTGEVLDGVEVLELGSALWSLLPQPDSRTIEAAADDRVSRPTRPRR